MIPLSSYQHHHVAVLGLGKSGMAAYEALKAAGANVVVWDDKGQSDSLTLTHYDTWDWAKLSLIVISPGVPMTYPAPHPVVIKARASGVRITSDITLLMEACPQARYVGITGTNGKSTTTALTAHCLEQMGADVQCGGNIGVPVLAMLPLGSGGIYVLELSSYQLDAMDAGVLNVACLLNITPDHLDRHGDMAGYIEAKRRIFRGQSPAQQAILAVDDEITRAMADTLPHAWRVSCRHEPKADIYMEDGWLVDRTAAEEARADISRIASLKGMHNHQNAVTAYAACRALGFEADRIYEAMQSFGGLAHRMERVAVVDQVLFINDSKATNADAASKSLAAYPQCHWIVGGVPKAGGIESLVEYFPSIAHAYCIGQSGEAFSDTLSRHNVPHTISGTLEKAVSEAFAAARGEQGAVILFAPAAASFDQFANFEARGDAFKGLVKEL